MNKLFTRYMTSAAVFIPPDGNTASDEAAKERDAINVTSSTSNSDELEKEVDQDGDNVENKTNENEDNNEDENDTEKSDENNNDEEVNNTDNETEEQKLAREKEERKQARQQRKWDRLAAEKTAAEKRVKELEDLLAASPKEGLTEEEVERRAEEIAKKKIEEQQTVKAQKDFEKTCDTLEAEAIKINSKFSDNATEMVNELGPVPVPLINILGDLDNKNGGEVLNYLTENIDEAEEIYELSERRMTQKLIRISDKLKEAKKPKPKSRSNAPDPIKPVSENGRQEVMQLTGKEDMETFARIRAKQSESFRRSKGF